MTAPSTRSRLNRWLGRRGPQAPSAETDTLVSPVSGELVTLSDVADPAFAAGLLGPGFAVVPTGGEVTSPVSGTLVSVLPHAYGLRSDDGLEVLVHVGIETVRLEGRHFRSDATIGARVSAGDLLAVVDLAAVSAEGFDTTVVVVVTNPAQVGEVVPAGPGAIGAGRPACRIATN